MSDLSQSGQQLPNWRITVSYDGTEFSGWQIQPGQPTVQGHLQESLRRITGEAPLPQGSGRTDAGVHALGQVASFALAAPIPPESLKRAFNRILPPSIRILEARLAPAEFHARHSAQAKTYEYRVFQGELCPPFLARYVYACRWPLDLGQMQRAAADFIGEHDFLSFAATDPDLTARSLSGQQPAYQTETAIRTIFSSAWETKESADGPLLVYRVRGSGFLHHMVRNLVGTMIDVGRGYRRAEEIKPILAARDRKAAGPTAPARGLFLHSVEYPD
jgi:tRNA pseudouridine38-40 synthase